MATATKTVYITLRNQDYRYVDFVNADDVQHSTYGARCRYAHDLGDYKYDIGYFNANYYSDTGNQSYSRWRVYLSDILNQADISLSRVSKINVSATTYTARTPENGWDSTTPESYTLGNFGSAYHRLLLNGTTEKYSSISNGVESTISFEKGYSSLSSSDYIDLDLSFTSSSTAGTMGYFYGINTHTWTVVVTYEDCNPSITKANVKYVDGVESKTLDVITTNRTGSSTTGIINLEGTKDDPCSLYTGTWKYSTDSGRTWTNVDTNSNFKARAGQTQLKYVLSATNRNDVESAIATINTDLGITGDVTAYCTAIKLTATGITNTLNSSFKVYADYYEYDEEEEGESWPSGNQVELTNATPYHTFTGLTQNTLYRYRITVNYGSISGGVFYENKGTIRTNTASVSLKITDADGTVHEGTQSTDQIVAYPQKLTVSYTTTCHETLTLQYKGSTDSSWQTVTNNEFYLVKPNDGTSSYNYTVQFKASITVGGQSHVSTQTWKLSPPTITPRFKVTNGEWNETGTHTANVFTTPSGSSFIYQIYSSTWDISNAITDKSKHYELTVDGTTATYTTDTVSTSIESDKEYSIANSYVAYSYNGTQVYQCANQSLTITPMEFTTGSLNLKCRNISGTIDILDTSEPYIETVSGELMTLDASGWKGTPTLTISAEQRSGSSGSWGTAPSENFTLTRINSSKYSIQPINISYQYCILYRVVSTDDVYQERESSSSQIRISQPYFTCEVGIVPIVEFAPDPAVGSTDTEFYADASDSYVMTQSVIYDLGFTWHLYSDSTLQTDIISDTTKVTITSGTTTSEEIKFKVLNVGTYYLTVNIVTTSGFSPSLSTTWGSDLDGKLIVKEITNTGITDYHRFCLVIKKGEKIFVASRERVPYLTNLKFGKYLSNIGTLTCTITGIDRVKMTDDTSISDVFDEPNAEVCLLDRMNPVWIGIVTEATEVETNYYNQSTKIKQYNIVCYESQKKLSVDYIPNNAKGSIAGTLTEISKKIIPTANQGQIGTSDVNYSISLSNTSRLTALDQLYSQAGWRYRCRPNTIVYWNSVGATSPYTITSVLEDKTLKVGSIAVFYNDEGYGCGIVGTYSNNQITLSKSFKLPTTTSHISIYDSFLVDFKPSYYQTANAREWVVNYNATNVEDVKNIRDKFGTVVVYGVGYSGETIASMMRAWMKINSDYTIDDSMRITKSYDSEIDTVVKLDEVQDNNDDTYSRYTITFNGWSFPDATTLLRFNSASIYPIIYFVSSQKNLHSMTISYPSDIGLPTVTNNPRRYYDQGNNKKTSYIIAVKNGDTVGSGSDSTLKTSVIESLVQLSNVIFPIFSVDKPSLLPAVNSSICVGDMKCTVNSINSIYSEVKVNFITSDWENTGIPHGHLTDVLVMDNSKQVNYDNADTNSPYVKYPDVSLTTQGPEGYSIMEMERLACRYMQYGSNYNSQGSCNITVPFFYRNDYEIGCSRLPMVGDRIALIKNEGENQTVSTYELQRYEFDLENYSCSIVFGMPILNIGEVIYNLLANSGMSIIPADSSSE